MPRETLHQLLLNLKRRIQFNETKWDDQNVKYYVQYKSPQNTFHFKMSCCWTNIANAHEDYFIPHRLFTKIPRVTLRLSFYYTENRTSPLECDEKLKPLRQIESLALDHVIGRTFKCLPMFFLGCTVSAPVFYAKKIFPSPGIFKLLKFKTQKTTLTLC